MAGDKGSDGDLGGAPSKDTGGQGSSDLFADLFGPNAHFDTSNLKVGDAAKDSTVIDSLSSYRTAEASPVESTSSYTALTGRADTVAEGTLPEISFLNEEPQIDEAGQINSSGEIASDLAEAGTEVDVEQTAFTANDKVEAEAKSDFKAREYPQSSRRELAGSLERVGRVSEPARGHLANLSQRFSNVG
jgi:hypothetical protein